MIDCFQQLWETKINRSERYSFYRSFKSLPQQEEYLKIITINKFRAAFTRFRLGMNELKMNRYFVNNALETICPFCLDTEDSLHFMLYCKGYKLIRDKYLEKHIKHHYPTELLCKHIFGNKNHNVVRDVAMYIFYALKYREEYLSLSI